MSRVNPIVQRLRDRLEHKRNELAELTLRVEAIRMGIDEDEHLLMNAVPKKPRIRKAPGKVENVENQLDAGPTGGK